MNTAHDPVPRRFLFGAISTLVTLILPAAVFGQATSVEAMLEPLHGTKLTLTGFSVNGNSIAIPASPAITLVFKPNSINGFAAVNRYFGGFEILPGDTIRWARSGFATTRMAGPQDLMDFEASFLHALAETTKVRLDSNRVVFESSDNQISMEFSPITRQPLQLPLDSPQLLVRLVFNGEEVKLPKDPTITLTLGSDGKLTGFSGVNHYFGGYRIDENNAIAFPGPGFGSTMMAGPIALMDLESTFLNALSSATTAKSSARGMTLANASQTTVLEFEAP